MKKYHNIQKNMELYIIRNKFILIYLFYNLYYFLKDPFS